MAPNDGERGLGFEGRGLESIFSGFGVHIGLKGCTLWSSAGI